MSTLARNPPKQKQTKNKWLETNQKFINEVYYIFDKCDLPHNFCRPLKPYLPFTVQFFNGIMTGRRLFKKEYMPPIKRAIYSYYSNQLK